MSQTSCLARDLREKDLSLFVHQTKHMKTVVRIALLATLLSGATVVSAQRRSLSLEEALSATLADNPAMKAAAFEEKAAREERRAAIGLRMPRIGLTGAYAYMAKDIGFDFNGLKGPANQMAGQLLGSGLVPPSQIPAIQGLLAPIMGADWFLKVQDRSLGFVGGEVTLPIWMGGKINAANRAARINELAAAEAGHQTRNALVSELVERYFGLALARQVVAVRQQVVDGVRKHLEDAEALERNGMIARSERLYVEFKMAEAERELSDAKLQEATIASALGNTLGSSADWAPSTAMFLLGELEELAYYQQLAERRNPLLEQVSLKRRLAEEGVRVQRSEFFPQVVAMGGGSFYNYQVAGLVPRWAVGGGVSFKLFDGLNREYKYSAAKQTARRVGELEEKAGNDIAVLVEQLYNQLQSYRNRMGSIEASLAFAEEYLRIKNAAFLEGMSSSSDLIDAELNLAGVRTERLQAAYNFDTLLARLLEAAGVSDEFVAYSQRGDARKILFE